MKRKLSWLLLSALMFSMLTLAPVASASTLASGKTSLSSASSAQLNNIELAVLALDGTYVEYGDTFSFNDIVGPRTTANGYKNAVNGRGVKAMGGGVAQVASTLYLALKQLDGIDYIEKKTYGSRYSGDYVSSSSDAIVTDYKNGTDFSFENYYGDFYISMWTTGNYVYCSLESYSSGESGTGDGIGYASIDLYGCSSALVDNVILASESIYDTALESYDVFSFNDIVGPRTERYGYSAAVNGRGVRVIGGGVAQVASAVWLAVRDLDCVEIVEKSTYGKRYNQDYVASADDAILTDYNAGTDFRFRYIGSGTLSIYTTVEDNMLICEVYEG